MLNFLDKVTNTVQKMVDFFNLLLLCTFLFFVKHQQFSLAPSKFQWLMVKK